MRNFGERHYYDKSVYREPIGELVGEGVGACVSDGLFVFHSFNLTTSTLNCLCLCGSPQ